MNWTSALAAHDRENRERKEKTNLESEATSSYNAGSADQTESNTSTTESQLEKRAMNEVWFVNACTGDIQFGGKFSKDTDFDDMWEAIENEWGEGSIAWLFSEGLPKFVVN